ncbi:MAG TPA: helix-turn-helix transcriptional regulator [Verrucomicrobiae bacterium]|jgi:cytoskeletal protein RodZ
MPTVAEQLRVAREARKLTILQMAEVTKIRTDHLRALEEGNFHAFSAPIYIRGSVKNYATQLKLDVPQVLADLDKELRGTEKFSEPPPLIVESKSFVDHVMFWLSKVNARVLMVAGGVAGAVVLVVLAGSFIHHYHRNNSAPNLPPAVYQSDNNGNTLPLPK